MTHTEEWRTHTNQQSCWLHYFTQIIYDSHTTSLCCLYKIKQTNVSHIDNIHTWSCWSVLIVFLSWFSSSCIGRVPTFFKSFILFRILIRSFLWKKRSFRRNNAQFYSWACFYFFKIIFSVWSRSYMWNNDRSREKTPSPWAGRVSTFLKSFVLFRSVSSRERTIILRNTPITCAVIVPTF